MQLAELAKLLGCELRGDGSLEIIRAAPIESAGRGDITFVANPRYMRFLETLAASAVILPVDAPDVAVPSLRSADPYLAFAKAVEHFYRPVPLPARHPRRRRARRRTAPSRSPPSSSTRCWRRSRSIRTRSWPRR